MISTGSQEPGGEADTITNTSPKSKRKAITGFWAKDKDKQSRKSQKSLFKKRPKDGVLGEAGVEAAEPLDNKAEDKHRRRFFSHYCAASVCASLSVTAQVKTSTFMMGLKNI